MTTLSKTLSGAVLLVLAAGLLVGCFDSAAPGEEKVKALPGPKYRGSSECLRCHTRQTGADSEEFVLLTEYTTWRLSDPHSLAYAALVGPRGQRIGRALCLDVTRQEAGCLACHTLHVPGRTTTREKAAELKREGVGCEVCHGPAEKWIGPHSEPGWRRRTPAQKLADGMVDLRDPSRQAKTCLSCHLGDAAEGKVLTHAMFAAGHPPLRSVELATFGDRMPRHWRLLPDVPYLKKLAEAVRAEPNAEDRMVLDSYHFQTAGSVRAQQVLATGRVCLRTEMALVAERSELSKDREGAERRWPELAMKDFASYRNDLPALWPQLAMAQADCYGCHHELRRPNWRQERGYSGPAGRPQLLAWPATLARLGVGLSRNETTALADPFRSLTAACNERPYGDPARLARTAKEIRDKIESSETAPVDHARLLTLLCQLPESEYPDFDSARQLVAGLKVVYTESLSAAGKRIAPNPAIDQWLTAWSDRLDLGPDPGRAARQRRLIETLAELSREKLVVDPKLLKALDHLADHGFDEFKTATASSDPALLRSVTQLLEMVRSREGARLGEVLSTRDAKVLQDLQATGDAQLDARLKKMRRYDPRELKKDLKKLAAMLPPAEK